MTKTHQGEEEKKANGDTIQAKSVTSTKGWEPLNFKDPNEYKSKAITNRWEDSRQKWFNVKHLNVIKI